MYRYKPCIMLRSRPSASSPGAGTKQKKRLRRKKRNSAGGQRSYFSSSSVLVYCICFMIVIIFLVQSNTNSNLNPNTSAQNLRVKSGMGSNSIDHVISRHKQQILQLPKEQEYLEEDSLYNLSFPSIDGEMIPFKQYAGHAAVVINVASE